MIVGAAVVPDGAVAAPDGTVLTPGAAVYGAVVVSVAGAVTDAGGHKAAAPSGTGPGPEGHSTVCAPGAVGVVCPPQSAPGKKRRIRMFFFIALESSQLMYADACSRPPPWNGSLRGCDPP